MTRDAGQRHPAKVEKKTMLQTLHGNPVPMEPGAKPPIGPLFGADEAENLSLLFNPRFLPAGAAEAPLRAIAAPEPSRSAPPGFLARLLPARAAAWF